MAGDHDDGAAHFRQFKSGGCAAGPVCGCGLSGDSQLSSEKGLHCTNRNSHPPVNGTHRTYLHNSSSGFSQKVEQLAFVKEKSARQVIYLVSHAGFLTRKIVVIGPESTGKSTLCRELANTITVTGARNLPASTCSNTEPTTASMTYSPLPGVSCNSKMNTSAKLTARAILSRSSIPICM